MTQWSTSTDLQKQRLRKLEHDCAEELEIIREEFDTERAFLMEQHNKEMNDIADILFAMEQNFNERENDAKADFQSMRDEIKNKVTIIFMSFFFLNVSLKKETRSIQRTQTPPRLSPLTCDVDLMTRSRTLKLSKIMLRLDKFCNHSFL